MTSVLDLNLTNHALRHIGKAPLALEVDRVGKAFGGRRRLSFSRNLTMKPVMAVSDVSMKIEPGEIYGVLGANGSGKTTLIRLIATLLLPDSGTVKVFGHNAV